MLSGAEGSADYEACFQRPLESVTRNRETDRQRTQDVSDPYDARVREFVQESVRVGFQSHAEEKIRSPREYSLFLPACFGFPEELPTPPVMAPHHCRGVAAVNDQGRTRGSR